jgi:hypothetical protein
MADNLQNRWAVAIQKAVDERDAAGRAMLAALEMQMEFYRCGTVRNNGTHDTTTQMEHAIATAKAAGITPIWRTEL